MTWVLDRWARNFQKKKKRKNSSLGIFIDIYAWIILFFFFCYRLFLAQIQCLFDFHLECLVHNELLFSFASISLYFLPLRINLLLFIAFGPLSNSAPRVIALNSQAAGDCLFNHDQSSGENWVFFFSYNFICLNLDCL